MNPSLTISGTSSAPGRHRQGVGGQFVRVAAFLAATVGLMTAGAGAQSYQDFQHPAAAQAPALRPDVIDPFAKAGPTIYVTDSNGVLSTVTLGTYTVHRIGSEGTTLTDIGFNPKDGGLYGISFSALYRLNRSTGRATFIGNLGISDANALVFDANGKPYVAGVNYAYLYTVNLKNGRASTIGSTYPFRSAGDLTFYNGVLVLSGYYQSSLGSSTPDTLAQLNPKTGAPQAYAELAVANLFGIVSTGPNLLFGFAGTSVYELYPNASSINKRAVKLKTLSGKGLGQLYGAAYNGYFQN